MHKKITALLFILSLILAWNLYGSYQENLAIKTGAIQEFAYNQMNIEIYLNEVIENPEDTKKVVYSLSRVISFMDRNRGIAANGSFVGKYIDMPLELFLINVDNSVAIYNAFEEALDGNLKEETLVSLIEYKEKIAVITNELHHNDIQQLSVREINKKLDAVAGKLK